MKHVLFKGLEHNPHGKRFLLQADDFINYDIGSYTYLKFAVLDNYGPIKSV